MSVYEALSLMVQAGILMMTLLIYLDTKNEKK
ncbi:MAG: putative holin-like toxin [Oscillospiraceae bacterium]|nr:putative holin-like toxin [Oscillospiraceae bacterium]